MGVQVFLELNMNKVRSMVNEQAASRIDVRVQAPPS